MSRKSVALAFLAGSTLFLGGWYSGTLNPKLTDGEKFEVCQAQVRVLQANQALQPVPQYQQVQQAQNELNNVLRKVMADEKVEPGKFQFNDKLELIPIQAATEPAKTSPSPEKSKP